jgi:2-oxoglutarate dehydrogenase E2 component (dihydrolipoamide succinyltransferase)
MAVNIVVPEMGESIVDARVAKWLKNEGDAVAVGEPLVELETDKVDVEVSAPQAGVLSAIVHKKGADVKIGDVLGTIEGGAGAPAPKPAAAKPVAAGSSDPAATPSARRLAREQNVELGQVKADGPRVTRGDVERAAIAPARPAPAAPAPAPRVPPAAGASTGDRSEERVRMSKRRATIAKRLVEVQQTAAMLTTFNEVDMSAVMQLRERQKQAFKDKHGVGLGIASFFVKAAVAALRECPRLNAEIQGDEMVLKHYYDIGVAVGAAGGLVVPVLRDADRLSFSGIELGIREFAKKANDGTLSLDDVRGGSFTITNGGVFGSLMSTPILNPPQVGILGLHAIKERPIGVAGQIVLRPMMYTALTYDHRIVDGAEAVKFLVRVKDMIEDPGALLIES